MLGPTRAVPYLLEREYIAAGAVVDGDVSVVDCSRRNRNNKVISDRGPCLLLKQGVGESGRATVAHEADVYRFLHSLPGRREFARYLPRFYAYDRADQVLVLELLDGAEDLREYHSRRRSFPTGVATRTARALVAFHRLTRSPARAEVFGRFKGRRPWVLSVHRPGLEVFRETSNANFQLLRIVQNQDGFPELLDEVREAWRSDAFVHHDVRWDNCLVHSPPGGVRKTAVNIVDWEFADLGDACWDAGAVFSAYLGFWLFSIPLTGEDPPERFLELAGHPLIKMQPAIRAFWWAYAASMGLDPATSGEWLLRAVRYAAVRLIQTGFEHLQKSAEMTGNVVCLLQLSFNILQRPREAIAHLLGIPLSCERPSRQ
jgi:hypothetical protein